MASDDPERTKDVGRKVLKIEGQENRGFRLNRRCKDVTIIRIRENEVRNTVLISPDIGIRQHLVHQILSPPQPVACRPTVGNDSPDPLLVDRIRPARRQDTVHPKLDQQIPNMERI